MLKNTFCHIPKITEQDEKEIWALGYSNWKNFKDKAISSLSQNKLSLLNEHLVLSNKQLRNGDPHYFANLLPVKNHWRLFPEFRNTIAYIDIETTGLSHSDIITTIALYDGKNIFTYVSGVNLDDFKNDILKYKVIVTYNGKSFDVPFIRRFLDIEMNHVHIDLRYPLFDLGYKGGLKKCEKSLGIDRGELEEVDGYFAVLLWREYQRTKQKEVLDTLLAYNIEDVVNLEYLMIKAYNLKLIETPFQDSLQIELPERIEIPFDVSQDVIRKIKYRF